MMKGGNLIIFHRNNFFKYMPAKKPGKEALYYRPLADGVVRCELCPNVCLIAPGVKGACHARQNKNGRLYSLTYGRPVAINIDPIEKKPLFHFLPGAAVFSLGTAGCNFHCRHCQNWEISQIDPEQIPTSYQSPEEIVAVAKKAKTKIIAFTYTEPTVFYEYMLDIARLAKKSGFKNIIVSNGYINPLPFKKLLPYIDGANIDLKGFTEDFYRRLTQGRLAPVLNNLKIIRKTGVHLEITYLIIPGENDNDKEISKMASWLKDNLGQDTILHFSRFYPSYKMLDHEITPKATITRARELALKAGLKYVYTGNLDDEIGQNTYFKDGAVAIRRDGFSVLENNLGGGRHQTQKCRTETIPGVWK